jgi:hypothetical protein
MTDAAYKPLRGYTDVFLIRTSEAGFISWQNKKDILINTVKIYYDRNTANAKPNNNYKFTIIFLLDSVLYLW